MARGAFARGGVASFVRYLGGTMASAAELPTPNRARVRDTHASESTNHHDREAHDQLSGESVPTSTLRELRERAGLTQNDLGTRAGVHEKTIWRIENFPERFDAKWATLRRIADALGVALKTSIAPAELLGRAPRLLEHDQIDPERYDAQGLPKRDVIMIWDLAIWLRSSVRTLKRILASRPWDLPATLPSDIDQRPRWARAVVVRWLAGDPTARGVRKVTPAKRPRRAQASRHKSSQS